MQDERTLDAPDAGQAAPAAVWGLTYQPALDGLRAVAALSVVGAHLQLSGFKGGSLGVDMFFVLSGFLITALILREISSRGRLGFANFYLRRGLRLLPAYLAVVAACVVGDLFVVDAGGTLRGALYSFFYVANWAAAAGHGLGTLGHTWSLSIEEQFYLLWPALLVGAAALSRRTRISVAMSVAVACALAWAVTAFAVFGSGVGLSMLNHSTLFRATELLSGCVLATIAIRGGLRALSDRRRLSAVLGVVSVVGLLLLVVVGHATSTSTLFATWVAVTACTAGFIASVQGSGTLAGRVLSVAPLVLVGKMSYGLYLWHYPILASVDAMVGLDSVDAKLVAVALTAVVVPASYYWLETPFLRLKSRVGRRQPAPAVLTH